MSSLKSIQWKLVLVYVLLLLFALELFGVYMLSSTETYLLSDIKSGLHNQVQLLASLAERYYSPVLDSDGLQQLISQYSNLIGRDVFLLDKYGVIVATSPGLEQMLGNRIVQQEVISAIQGTPAEATRLLPDTGQRIYYYSVPVYNSGNLVGIAYASTSLEHVDATLNQLRNTLLTGAVLTLVFSTILGLSLSSAITRPLKKITKQAELMKSGDFSQSIKIHSEDEIGQLAETFNELAVQLQRSWDDLIQEKDKVEGILTNLSDGLIVFDHAGRVMHINSTACNWLKVNKQKTLEQGKVEDFPELDTERGIIYLEGEFGLVLRQQRLPFLQAGKKQGTVVVLSDITEQSRLDAMRQEFVANVSHELRTPLTSIKTYLEALHDNPDEKPEIRERFLGVISSETDRMVRMVEDLLILSRNETGHNEFRLVSVSEILRELVKGIQVQAASKGIRLELRTPWHLPLVMGNQDQLHRLFLNIVTNAIAYTPEGKVTISARSRNKYLEVIVRDTGIGIPEEALGRIFERFYRVDKARSRKAGGTGLGLSIAKQIAEAHGGTINITSHEGKGTVVTIPLPIAARQDLHADSKGGRES